ncbi:MAG TPA: phosphate signaling complex protein PhoU [Actinomycetota bacterium]|nr:phosphate signaling complex protein PhoU [Actinomycetota bacterium]
MSRQHFHEQLERVELELLSMGELAATSIQRAVQALVEQDEALARQVIADDDPIDRLYLSIDHDVLEMLALQSPVASQLRLVSAILHSCHHLERIGDQAVNIAKLFLATKDLPPSRALLQQLDEMGTHVVAMIRTAMEAFRTRDLELCLKLPKMDDPVDRLNRATHLEALKLADDPRSLEWGLHMNLSARALERVGDNAVDIAEQVAFLITGEYREFTDASHEVEEPEA